MIDEPAENPPPVSLTPLQRRDAAVALLASDGWNHIVIPWLKSQFNDRKNALLHNRMEHEDSAVARDRLNFIDTFKRVVRYAAEARVPAAETKETDTEDVAAKE